MTAGMRWYGVVSLGLIALYPFLPVVWAGVAQFAVFAGATAAVWFGRRAVPPGRRRPWTLLLASFAIFCAANLLLAVPGERTATVGRFVDATGYLVLLATTFAFVAQRGVNDLGRVIDAAVMAVSVGGVLWLVLPHRIGPDTTFRAQFELFVVLVAIGGALGMLLRLTLGTVERLAALRWLQAGVGLLIAGNVAFSLAGTSLTGRAVAIMLLMAALAATGLFGLDPTAPRLAYSQPVPAERLSAGRLVFLGVAVALIPVATGVLYLLDGRPTGVLLPVGGVVVAALVMVRIGLLSAQRDQAERALVHRATHDPLTRLPNRRGFIERLSAELDRGTRCVLLFCDLDGFKQINDRLGHEAGDEVLVEVARRIDACVAARHIVSRLGGDEFVVLLIDVAPSEVQATRACIARDLARPFEHDGDGIGVSIGIAYADGVRDPERLVQSADNDMYRVKAAHNRARGARSRA